MTKYRNHDERTVLLSQQYGEHVSAMTTEELHGKAEIAEELAARDIEIARLRKGLGAARAIFIERGDTGYAAACDTFLMGSNAPHEGPSGASREGPLDAVVGGHLEKHDDSGS